MKMNEVVIGAVYLAKVSNKITRVRIDKQCKSHNNRTYWLATNLSSGRVIRIGSAARLRRRCVENK